MAKTEGGNTRGVAQQAVIHELLTAPKKEDKTGSILYFPFTAMTLSTMRYHYINNGHDPIKLRDKWRDFYASTVRSERQRTEGRHGYSFDHL